MNLFRCNCGNTLYFANSLCLACQNSVAYDPSIDSFISLQNQNERLCENGQLYQNCNWVRLPNSSFCEACHLNRIIPDLSGNGSVELWSKLEHAKRRTLYGMMKEGLHFKAWQDESEGKGLAFEFKQSSTENVLTGYLQGTITINLKEADDVERERTKLHLGESYRTLIGHFRHEIGHYVWDYVFNNLQWDNAWRQRFNAIFGDPDALDYQQSLRAHYQQKDQSSGNSLPPQEFISDYAAVHPSEDWAESWAHYWHIMDALQTYESFSLGDLRQRPNVLESFEPIYQLSPEQEELQGRFRDKLSQWIQLSPAINEIATSLGHPALYPFLTSPAVVQKLTFVHLLVRELSKSEMLRHSFSMVA